MFLSGNAVTVAVETAYRVIAALQLGKTVGKAIVAVCAQCAIFGERVVGALGILVVAPREGGLALVETRGFAPSVVVADVNALFGSQVLYSP